MNHVLIVDADTQLRNIAKKAFEAAGFTAAAVSSAERAIAACEERQPDVIVLDLQLRGHSGVELLHELRSYAEWQQIPIVLYTGVPQSDLVGFDAAFTIMGIKAYCYKPETSLKKLTDVVRDLTALPA